MSLTGVALSHHRCLTAAHSFVSVSLQVSHCCSLGNCIFSGVPLPLTGLVLCCLMFSTAAHCGGFVFPDVPLTVT